MVPGLRVRRCWMAVCLGIVLWAAHGAQPVGLDEGAARLRRPAALAWFEEDRLLGVANERSGSVSLVDVESEEVVGEFAVGERLSDLVVLPGGERALAVDQQGHEVIGLAREGDRLRVFGRLGVARFPVRVEALEVNSHGARPVGLGGRVAVASLWSRRVTVVEVTRGMQPADFGELRVVREVAVPFAPREMVWLPGEERLLVADGFGGHLAVVNVDAGEVEHVHELPAHNIRDLALSRDAERLLISHQVLEEGTPTTFDAVHWGVLMVNAVRSVEVARVLDAEADLVRGSLFIPLGDVGNGGGDPAEIAVGPGGGWVVALAGVHQVAVLPADRGTIEHVDVGRRPTAVLLSGDGGRAYVANTFGDSVSVVGLGRAPHPDRLPVRGRGDSEPTGRGPWAWGESEVVGEVELGEMRELSPAERGELLFYDARLSHDGWFSCHSCHTDGHSNGGLVDTLGDGSFGAPKRVLSLRGVGMTDRWAWNGSIKHLHEQIAKSARTTMRGEGLSSRQAVDLAAFLHSLPPAPPVISEPELEASATLRESVQRGRRIFEREGCVRCHVPPLTYTTFGSFDVGLEDEAGNRKFNPPSLRGVSQRSGYFHDKRAESLEAVFREHGHQLREGLSEGELEDLVRFLGSL